MKQNRRNFMKGTGAVWAMAFAGRLPATLTKANPAGSEAHGMPRGLILLNIRRGAEYRLGVKSDKGVLDVCLLYTSLSPLRPPLNRRRRA